MLFIYLFDKKKHYTINIFIMKRWTGNISLLTGIAPITPTLTPGRRRYSTVMQVSTAHREERTFIVMQVSRDHDVMYSVTCHLLRGGRVVRQAKIWQVEI
jgi:hypothetical protein